MNVARGIQTDYPALNQPQPEEISLGELRQAASRAKWAIVCFVVACTAAAGAIAWIMPPTYTATVTMADASMESSSGLSGKLGSLLSGAGGLSALAGLALPSNSKAYESVAVLQSESLTQQFIQQHGLLPILFPKKWNPETRRWQVDDPRKIPTLWDGTQYFKKIRNVNIDARTGLIKLTMKWKDPLQAAEWANDLVAMTNDYLRNQAIAESDTSIAYLNQEAARTTVVEARQAIFAVLQAEINRSMLARGTQQFAFRILDPAFAPEKPSSLSPKAWMAIAFIASSLLASLGVFLQVAWNKS